MTPIEILLYIAVWTLCVNALTYAFTGKLPHDYLPAVKARKQRLAIAAAAEKEADDWRREALASLKKEDIAFLTAGSHWTPPHEVQYRIDLEKKNEHFARQIKRAATPTPAPSPKSANGTRQAEFETVTAQQRNVDKMIKLYRSLGIPFDEVHVTERAEPVAIIAHDGRKIDSVQRQISQYGHEIEVTYYSDGSTIRRKITPSERSVFLD